MTMTTTSSKLCFRFYVYGHFLPVRMKLFLCNFKFKIEISSFQIYIFYQLIYLIVSPVCRSAFLSDDKLRKCLLLVDSNKNFFQVLILNRQTSFRYNSYLKEIHFVGQLSPTQ